MKTIRSLLLTLILAGFSYLQAQEKSVYITTYLDIPLTWATVTDNGENLSGAVRFAPFFNFGNNVNVDFSEKAGFFGGWNIQNTGFIYDVDANTRKKVRNYYLGIPVGLKFGNMDKAYFYVGYELELPFNYKEKTFVNEVKTKFNTWFSNRSAIQQSVIIGAQLPYGANIKFKYYFTNFYKQSYTESDGQGGSVYPYANFKANIFWVSLTFELFRGWKFVYVEE